jgi:hypothetical protein
VTNPNHPGYWWAKGKGPNADLGWQVFVADTNLNTGSLVVRLPGALHARHPWFTPSRQRWVDWHKADLTRPEFMGYR